MVKCCVDLQTSSSKTQVLLLAKNIIIKAKPMNDGVQ